MDVHVVEIVRRPDAAEADSTVAFVEQVAARSRTQPMSDHLWLDLRAGGSRGFHLVRVLDETGLVAIAQISAANDSSSLEIVNDPDLRPDDRRRIVGSAAAAAIESFRRGGGGRLFWWLDGDQHDLLDLAASHGIEPVRTLYEMRRRLPHERRAGIVTRPFRPGVDDDEWIEVNNRAFANHGEQGGWTRSTLDHRMAEPWFDPTGFRIHERDGRIAGFCWTKIHHDLDPVVGEIYVIAVDPDHHGSGLGTQLTLAGLDAISDRGVDTANLYVDADNTAAVGLYDRLGFTIHRTRIACAADLTALAPPDDSTDELETT